MDMALLVKFNQSWNQLMYVNVIYDVHTEQISKTLFCLLEAFKLQKLVVSPFPLIAKQFSVDELSLNKNCIAALAKE